VTWGERLRQADLDAFYWATHRETPRLDRAMERLTSSADHGLLWYGVSAALAATGHRGRRAAVRGLLGLTLASSVANVPAKFAVRRRRPPLTKVPLSRQLRRQPTTLSFPSGHSASAAGFAVGASLEWPVVALPAGALAAGVAWGRVHTGVHYPGDVLGGVLLGAAASLLLTRPWPPKDAEPARAAPAAADAPALADGDGLVIVLNADPDSRGAQAVIAAVRTQLPAAVCIPAGEDVRQTLKDAASGARALGVYGGDGTVNAAAAVALEQELPLVVLPGGTLNHFAVDLGNIDVDCVLEAVQRGDAVRVDVGETDDGIFLNTASDGGYPEMVAFRERLETDIGKWPAAFIGLVRTLRRTLPMDVEVDGRRRRLWMLFVGNCAYQPPGVAIASRQCLDDGILDVRLFEATRWSRIRLIVSALLGRLDRCPAYDARHVEQMTLRLLDEPRPVARDGEVCDPINEVHFRKRRRALTVYRSR
jgi:undecaprenyl-diphosphatase